MSKQMRPAEITFVTGNAKKLEEVQFILSQGKLSIPLKSRALDLDEVQGTTQDVARHKCRQAAEIVGGPVITEDTALGFKALGGLPGPYIKWFLAEIGHVGLNNLLAAYTDKSADAICTFAYCAGPGSEVLLFEGISEGDIVPARGPALFGWDPVFQPKGWEKTYAEMSKEEKNALSHRYKAVDKLRRWLESLE